MEKRAVIDDANTRPESSEKQAKVDTKPTTQQLEQHTSKRTADKVCDQLKQSN